MPATRIVVPAKAKKGEMIEIKTLINHPHGDRLSPRHRRQAIPRDIITRFTCTYAGEEVFRMDLFTGVAANPFVAFTTIATETGDLVFEWTDQHGAVTREQARLTVTVTRQLAAVSQPACGWEPAALVCLRALLLCGSVRCVLLPPALPAATRGHPAGRAAIGQEFVSAETRAQQDDLTVNPGMLWVEQGDKLWREAAGPRASPAPPAMASPRASKASPTRYPLSRCQARAAS